MATKHYNFVRIHQALHAALAMAAGVTEKLKSVMAKVQPGFSVGSNCVQRSSNKGEANEAVWS
jgi:hypothetical protein